MASARGHSSRAQLYKKHSARGWPNKLLAEGSITSINSLTRILKHSALPLPTTELVLFSFCPSLPRHIYVSVQNTSILSLRSKTRRENQDGPSWQMPKLTCSKWRTVKAAPPAKVDDPFTVLQHWAGLLNWTGRLKDTCISKIRLIHPSLNQVKTAG